MAAVAVEGFAEIAGELRRARTGQASPRAALGALADAYLEFARAKPAVYAAMFVREIDVEFGSAATPAPLKAAFGELLGAVEPLAAARGADPEALTEVFWSALHGLATLEEGHRLRPRAHRTRVDLLIDLVAAGT